MGARGRRGLDPPGAGTVGPSPRVELRRGRAAQHRTQPERDDGRARRPAPRDRRARRGLRGRLADGAVPPRRVPGPPPAPRAQRGARDVAPARRARDQPVPQAVGSAGGPSRPAVRGGSALTLRRRVRGLRTRPRHARRARHERAPDRPAPERRRPRTPRTPRAHPVARTRAAVPRHALVAAERRGALALPRRRPPRPARTRARRPPRRRGGGGARAARAAGPPEPRRRVRGTGRGRRGPVPARAVLRRRRRRWLGDQGQGPERARARPPGRDGPRRCRGARRVLGRAPADRRRSGLDGRRARIRDRRRTRPGRCSAGTAETWSAGGTCPRSRSARWTRR